MSAARSYREIRKAVSVLIALLCVSSAGFAALTVQDEFERAGVFAVRGAGWEAVLKQDEGALALSAGKETVQVVPFNATGDEADAVVSCAVVGEAAKEAVELAVGFAAQGDRIDVRFRFDDAGTLCVTPGTGTQGVSVRADVAVGVLPGIRLEDVLYVPEALAELDEIRVPSENWFAGLLTGGNGIVACAWPDGKQKLALVMSGEDVARRIDALRIELDGRALHVGLLAAPRIWHKESLELSYLEKNVAMDWKPPFRARYKTQIPIRAQTTTVRTFHFLSNPIEQYRPEVGSVAWPVWFEGGEPRLRLSKKIPPGGNAIVYPMDEGDLTLMGFLDRTPVAEGIEKRNARADLPRGPRGAVNVGFVACGGTQLIRRAVFASGLQHREREFLSEYADFLADYVAIVQQRNMGFFAFVQSMRDDLQKWLAEGGDDVAVHSYLEAMVKQAEGAQVQLHRKMEWFGENTAEGHMERGARAADRLKELLNTGGAEAYPECEELIDQCNRLAWGHAEVMGMRFSMVAREWAQEAALGCAEAPEAAPYAERIRAAIRTALNACPPW